MIGLAWLFAFLIAGATLAILLPTVTQVVRPLLLPDVLDDDDLARCESFDDRPAHERRAVRRAIFVANAADPIDPKAARELRTQIAALAEDPGDDAAARLAARADEVWTQLPSDARPRQRPDASVTRTPRL